nr:splicing factor [Tanacetum cinerariifolium]
MDWIDENIDEPDDVGEEYYKEPENIDFHVEGEQYVVFEKREMNKKKKAAAEGDKMKGKKVVDASGKVKGKKVIEECPKKPVKWTRMRVLEHKGHHCPFRLWANWMSSERWITRHYARDIILNSDISYKFMREDIREKYMVNVSLGQCKRAKQCALYEHDGGLIEHYGL